MARKYASATNEASLYGDKYQMKFGMHKGKALKDIPEQWLRWILTKPRVGQYLKDSIRAHLERRAAGTVAK